MQQYRVYSGFKCVRRFNGRNGPHLYIAYRGYKEEQGEIIEENAFLLIRGAGDQYNDHRSKILDNSVICVLGEKQLYAQQEDCIEVKKFLEFNAEPTPEEKKFLEKQQEFIC